MNIEFKALTGFLNSYNELLLECESVEDFEKLVSAVLAFAELSKNNFEESGRDAKKLMPAAKKLAEVVIEHAESIKRQVLQQKEMVN